MTNHLQFFPDFILDDLKQKASEAGLSLEEYYDQQQALNDATVSERAVKREKHPNQDFFVCDIVDWAPKDSSLQMEAPLFALSTRRDCKTFKWEHRGNSLEILPSSLGRSTQHDKDVLIYVISQLVRAQNNNQEVSKNVYFTPHDFLVSTNRQTSGRGYELLKNSLKRLASTSINLKYKMGEYDIDFTGHLLESVTIVTKEQSEEHAGQISVTISNLLFDAVKKNNVLTLSRDYFKLRKPMERRLYELARKHCGSQRSWKVGLETLHHKTGSESPIYQFKYELKKMISIQPLPDYLIEFGPDMKNIIFIKRIKKNLKSAG
jgi:plasmid replication initiation protein